METFDVHLVHIWCLLGDFVFRRNCCCLNRDCRICLAASVCGRFLVAVEIALFFLIFLRNIRYLVYFCRFCGVELVLSFVLSFGHLSMFVAFVVLSHVGIVLCVEFWPSFDDVVFVVRLFKSRSFRPPPIFFF